MGPAPPRPGMKSPPATRQELMIRLAVTAVIVTLYLLLHEALEAWLEGVGINTPPAVTITLAFASLVATWWRFIRDDPRFYAPVLITYILAVADATAHILKSHHSDFLATISGDRITAFPPTFVAIAAAIILEIVLAKFMTGKMPHLASAYISGISAGILVQSSETWPFVLTAWISITSKYVLRVRGRHLWNPTNFGMSVMLILASRHMYALSVDAGNTIWPVVIIWILGSLILYKFKLLHMPWLFVACFVPLAYVRSLFTGDHFSTEVAIATSAMFQLFIFFMITDPKTITKPRWSQCLVVVLIAVTDTLLRLLVPKTSELGTIPKYALFYALFIVGPAANLIEILLTAAKPKAAKAPVPVVAAVPAEKVLAVAGQAPQS
jgi:enediyne biosynthesis protein E5